MAFRTTGTADDGCYLLERETVFFLPVVWSIALMMPTTARKHEWAVASANEVRGTVRMVLLNWE